MDCNILPSVEEADTKVATTLHDIVHDVVYELVNSAAGPQAEIGQQYLAKEEELAQNKHTITENPKNTKSPSQARPELNTLSPAKRHLCEDEPRRKKKPRLKKNTPAKTPTDWDKVRKRAEKKLGRTPEAKVVPVEVPVEAPVHLAPAPGVFDPLDDSKCPVEEAEKRVERERRKAERRAKKEASRSSSRAKPRSRAQKRRSSSRPKRKPKRKPKPKARRHKGGQPHAELAQSPELGDELSRLDKFPLEVRIKIYQHLLVARKPIRVHGFWKQVYRHQGLSIPTGILTTSRQVYSEAVGVLYGCNRFVYRLRDAAPTLTDVSQLPHIDDDGVLPSNNPNVGNDGQGNDETQNQADNDSDPEWQHDGEESDADDEADDSSSGTRNKRRNVPRTRRRGQQTVVPYDICIEKYAHMIRHIVIEAEQNRYFPETLALMARAIAAFKRYDPTAKKAVDDQEADRKKRWTKKSKKQQEEAARRKERFKDSLLTSQQPLDPSVTNIHTLTVRVAPKWDDEGGDPENPGIFTFVDFFVPESRVMRAISLVQSQFLRIDLMTAHMQGPSERSGRTYKLDMRHRNLVMRRQLTDHDPWRNDSAMEMQREDRNNRINGQLKKLAEHIHRFCELHLDKGWDIWGDEIDAEEIDNGF